MISERQYYEGTSEDSTPEEQFKQIHTTFRRGDVIGVRGFPGKSNKGQLSVIPRSIELLAPCIRELPASKDALKDPDVRFRKRYLDLLVNQEVMQTFMTRAAVIRFLRTFLEKRSFIEVETPILCTSAGGAAARPFTTHLRAFDMEQQLRIAPELSLKKLIVGGFERVFEIGKNFRNEGVDPSHNPEFTMCEFYEAYADYYSLMDTTEAFLSELCVHLRGSTRMEPLRTREGNEVGEAGADKGTETVIDFTPPYRRIPIVEGLRERIGEADFPADLDVNDSVSAPPVLLAVCDKHGIKCAPPHTCARLLDKLVEHFLEPECVQPTFLCDHPICLSPLAKNHRDKVCTRHTGARYCCSCARSILLLVDPCLNHFAATLPI
jgi:lysyl-tRNA synthetase class 2